MQKKLFEKSSKSVKTLIVTLIYIQDLNSIQINSITKAHFILLKKVQYPQKGKNLFKGKKDLFNCLCNMVENMMLVNIMMCLLFR